MTERKEPREFWIDPNIDDESEDCDVQQYDAFDKHPQQGPLLWQSQLIKVREVLPDQDQAVEEFPQAEFDQWLLNESVEKPFRYDTNITPIIAKHCYRWGYAEGLKFKHRELEVAYLLGVEKGRAASRAEVLADQGERTCNSCKEQYCGIPPYCDTCPVCGSKDVAKGYSDDQI